MRPEAEGPAMTLFGRAGERERVHGLLLRAPLITITGLPGVGKSAMALEAATTAAGFPDGLWVVPLGGLDDPGSVTSAITRALPGGPVRALLVLDACEHVTAACAEAAAVLLAGRPDLRIIATSRRPLRLAGEHVLTLPPLDEGSALDLFLARADAVVPDPPERGEAAALCRRLDGLPLAIELVARRLAGRSVAQVAADLDRLPLRHLGTGGEGRHDSLVHAIGWSHRIATPAQRLLWARLSVFPGSFGLADVVFVCAGHPLPASRVEETLLDLADSALLLVEHERGGVTYRMPWMLRAYGAHMLDLLGEGVEVRRRHEQWADGFGP